MRRTRWAAAIVAAAAVTLTACSGTPAPAPAAEPSTLAAYYAQHLNWQPCDGGFECAQFVVPFDYGKPDGPRFTLPVVKLPAADPAHRVGALVINPGGPGGSGVQYALGARLEFPPAVLDRFDIVGFDPRGVGASQPALNCENGPRLDTFLATDDEPSDPAQLARVIAVSKQFAAPVRTQLCRPAALRRHAQRGTGHGRTAGRTRRIPAHLLGKVIRNVSWCVVRTIVPAPWPRSLAPWQSAASTAEKAAPMFGAAIVWGSLTCAYWPVESYPQPRIKAAGAPPILVVGTLRDPATPYRWAQAMAGDLASGVLLGWNGDGHTAYGEGSACVDAIVNDYLIDLAVPRSGTVCQH